MKDEDDYPNESWHQWVGSLLWWVFWILVLFLGALWLSGCTAVQVGPKPVVGASPLREVVLPPAPPGFGTQPQVRSLAVVLVAPMPQRPFTLAADFVATTFTNLVAFIEATTNLVSPHWVRQSLPYPTNGGTLRVPWTNVPVYFRAGYSLSGVQ